MVTNGNELPSFAEQWAELMTLLDTERQTDPRKAFKALARSERWRSSYWVLRQINQMGVEIMARGTKKPVQAKATGSKQWTNFVEISMAGHELADVENQFGSMDTLFDAMAGMLTDGYRVSLSHNVQNDAIIASVTCKDDESVNAGCTYTSFAGDWITALRIACYKHYVVTEQAWAGAAGSASRPLFG